MNSLESGFVLEFIRGMVEVVTGRLTGATGGGLGHSVTCATTERLSWLRHFLSHVDWIPLMRWLRSH